jgi:hypothetical protein
VKNEKMLNVLESHLKSLIWHLTCAPDVLYLTHNTFNEYAYIFSSIQAASGQCGSSSLVWGPSGQEWGNLS